MFLFEKLDKLPVSKWSNEAQLLGPHPTGAADSSVVIIHVKLTSIQPITNGFKMKLSRFFIKLDGVGPVDNRPSAD